MRRRRISMVAVALAGTLLTAGCGDDTPAGARETAAGTVTGARPAEPAGSAPGPAVSPTAPAPSAPAGAPATTSAEVGCPGGSNAGSSARALAPTGAGYLGTARDDAANGIDIGSDCTIVIGGHFTAGVLAEARRLAGGGAGAVIRLDSRGRKVISATRIAGTVDDLEVRRTTGDIAVATDKGVRVLDPTAARIRWKAAGAVTRVAVGDAGTLATVGGTTVRIYTATGEVSGTVRLAGTTVNDVAVDDRNGLVVVTGFRQAGGPCGQVQVPFVRAYRTDGTLRWKLYDFDAGDLHGLCADSRGDRVTIGRDGLLYFAGEMAGGNTVFAKNGRSTKTDAPNVGYDDFTRTTNTSSAHLTYIARLDPATGRIRAGQTVVARLRNGKGNTITARAITADAAGRVYVGGSSAAQIDGRDALTMNGRRLNGYAGGDAWLMITSPDLRKRLLWTAWTDGGTGEVRAVAAAGRVAAVAAKVEKAPFHTTAAPQSGTGGGYAAVFPSRR